MRLVRYAIGLAVVVGALVSAGCRVSGPTGVTVPSDRYAAAFDGAQDLLREQGFELERVDARAGVITTRPQASSGFWTPWVTSERRMRDEVESTFHRQRRRVEVRFASEGAEDVRLATGPVTVDVDVRVERVYQPGVRASSASVRLRHVASRPGRDMSAAPVGEGVRDESRVFAVDHSSDRALAAALAERLAERLGVRLPREERVRRGAPDF